ncbi:MAG: methylenetetrahydrofolate reductase [Firmicutes bacterium]|nr:methylenetetrahydrofolate reductase [Bacillota bacterium]
MKIIDLYKPNKTVISFEIFPPKKDGDIDTVYRTMSELKVLAPDFISVTFGAGGKTRGSSVTTEIVRQIQDKHGVPSLAHLTCCGSENISEIVLELKLKGIENILALRGDEVASGGFQYAKDLIAAISGRGFCIGAAAYPEGHIACDDLEKDIVHLKQKQDAGAEFFITQLFFDNALFYNFLEKARAAGIKAPISAGLMPILSKAQIARMIFMCGASLPSPIIKLINRYGDEGESLVKAGIEYSLNQMQNLCDNGVEGIHIYTMNKPFIAEYCVKNLRVKRV